MFRLAQEPNFAWKLSFSTEVKLKLETKLEHSRGSTKLSIQNLRQIGPRVN